MKFAISFRNNWFRNISFQLFSCVSNLVNAFLKYLNFNLMCRRIKPKKLNLSDANGDKVWLVDQKQLLKGVTEKASLKISKFLVKKCIFNKDHCVKSIQIRSFFWSVFSCIRTEYGDLRSKFPYSAWMQEIMDQEKLRIRTLFTQWSMPAKSFNYFIENVLLRILGNFQYVFF